MPARPRAGILLRMTRLALILLLAVPSSAQRVSSLGVPKGASPAAPAVFGMAAVGWRSPMEKLFLGKEPLLALPGLEGARPDRIQAALAPALLALERSGEAPEAFAGLPTLMQASRLTAAVRQVSEPLRLELDRLEKGLAALPANDPALPAAAARLELLAGPYQLYLDDARKARAVGAAKMAESRLEDEKRRQALEAAERMALALALPAGFGEDAAGTPVVQIGGLTKTPAYLKPSIGFKAKLGVVKTRHKAIDKLVMPVYRGLLYKWHVKIPLFKVEAPLNFKGIMEELGNIYRAYLSGREMDRNNSRWWFLKSLHSHAKDGKPNASIVGAFGSAVHPGTFEVMSPVIPPGKLELVKSQKIEIGGLVAPHVELVVRPIVNALDSISGMSFPQLTGRSHLTLLYIHLKLAKERGLRALYNTGEGGPGFALSMLEGDREKLLDAAVRWNIENGRMQPGSWKEAELVAEIDEYMALRNKLFAEFTPEDLKLAQVVAQFGSALNGVRDENNRVGYSKLAEIAASPFIVMTQYKFKQAAKRGSKVDPKKVTDLVAAFRDLHEGKNVKSPDVNPDFATWEEIAAMVIATREITRKPVSLKFAIGDVEDARDFLMFLRGAGALPDHIQLDGRGVDFSPGSGNAPPDANTSHPADEALIATHAILKQLGVREKLLLDATGDIRLPSEGVKMLALGGDMISMARGWMVKALGCALVRACNSGACPYGIAAGGFFNRVLDPLEKGPQGFAAAADWADSYARKIAEIKKAKGWLQLWKDFGLEASGRSLRQQGEDGRTWSLRGTYKKDWANDLLGDIMSPQGVDKHVYGR